MGASLSQNVSKIIVKSIFSTSNKVLKRHLENHSQSNIITIKNSKDVEISNNKNIQKISVNFNLLSQELQQNDNRIEIDEKIAQLSKSVMTNLNILDLSDTNNILNNIIQSAINIKNESILDCSSKSVQKIEINIKNSKNVKIHNNINEQYIKTISKCVENLTNENKIIQDVGLTMSQTSISEMHGLSLSFIGIILIVFMIAIGGVGTIGSYLLYKLIIPILSVGLGVFCVKKYSETNISSDFYCNKSIKNMKDCNNIKLNFFKDLNYNQIKNKCLSEKTCYGFELDSKNKNGYIFNSELDKSCKNFLKHNSKDDSKILIKPKTKLIDVSIKLINDETTYGDTFLINYDDFDIIFLEHTKEIWAKRDKVFEFPISSTKHTDNWERIFFFEHYKNIFFTNVLPEVEIEKENKVVVDYNNNSFIIYTGDPYNLKEYMYVNGKLYFVKNINFLGMIIDSSLSNNLIISEKKNGNILYLYASILCFIITFAFIIFQVYSYKKKNNGTSR